MTHPTSIETALKTFRSLILAAVIATFLLIVLGGMVRATASGGACPDWPTCLGGWTPPAGALQAPWLDYWHRVLTVVAGLPILAAAAYAWRFLPAERALRQLMGISLGLFLAQIGLGAAVGLALGQPAAVQSLSPWTSGTHLLLSLLLLACLVAGTVIVFQRLELPARELRFALPGSPFGRMSLLAFAGISLLLVGGSVVARSGAAAACTGWPLCLPQSEIGWLAFAHRLATGAAAVLMLALLWQAWRTQRGHTPVIVASTAAAVLFFSQALLGARLVEGTPVYFLALHQATATAVWAVMVVQMLVVAMAGRAVEDEQADAASIVGRRGLAKDLLLLTKPIVVALLLVTTYAGMVIGAERWPSLELTLWTLLGGFLAAGGSGAINQYIDRYDDLKMQRTQNRPLPSGRLTPGEGLAFGVALLLISFYLLVAFVNLLAALLSLAGMIYYVLIYSIFLKKTTVQNIVIGGGAGAIPPLVGWAAATGSLNIPSFFLFAVIFMWTPPHFWALALVRRNDYARAGVPMLPVVRGEVETRRQILIYTLELVALTLLLPLFGLGGSLYLVGAAILGLWLLHTAWKMHQEGGNKLAWKMYRYSSMYLAFLFMVLMVDALL